MTDQSPKCYIPSFVVNGALVPEKMCKGFLPYMGVGHLIKMPQTNVRSLTHGYSTLSLAFIGPVVLEMKIFEQVDGWMDD